MRPLYDRFAAAVRTCVGPEPVKTRLSTAWIEHLDAIDPVDMPGNLHQEFRKLRRAMYAAEPLPDEPAPLAAVRKMSAQQAAQYADRIVLLASELQALCLRQQVTGETDTQQQIPFGRGILAPERLN